MSVPFYILAIITGVLTSFTDIVYRKIRNLHLALLGSCAIVLYGILIFRGELTPSLALVLNPLVALLIGFVFYVSGLWRAGDAKLFLVYSLLLAENRYVEILPLSCLVLLFCSFIAGFIGMLPLICKDIISNGRVIIKKVISVKTLTYFGKILLVAFSVSWILFPALGFLPLSNDLFLQFVLLYISYRAVYKSIDRLTSRWIIVVIFCAGLIARAICMPASFTFTHLVQYTRRILCFSAFFYLLRNIAPTNEAAKQRMPFAPFMFLGAMLSVTGFLWRIIELLSFLRR